MNFFGIGRDMIDFVADRCTVKQGKLTPGTHLPILPPEAAGRGNPDYVLLLTWNFADEILAAAGGLSRSAAESSSCQFPQVRIV